MLTGLIMCRSCGSNRWVWVHECRSCRVQKTLFPLGALQSSPLLRRSLHIARKGDAVVLLVVEHSTETYFLHRAVSFCINCRPLHKEMSLMRSESCTHYGYWDMNLEGSVIACLLSKRIVVDSPVRHMGSSIVGSWPDLQHQAYISFCGKDPRSLWFSTSGIAVLTSSQILLPLQVCCPYFETQGSKAPIISLLYPLSTICSVPLCWEQRVQ